jgi:hypothetical protein
MAAARERLGKHVSATTDKHTKMNGVLCAGRADELQGRQLGQSKSVLYWSLWRKGNSWKRVERESPFREDLSTEAEESLLLEAVTQGTGGWRHRGLEMT